MVCLSKIAIAVAVIASVASDAAAKGGGKKGGKGKKHKGLGLGDFCDDSEGKHCTAGLYCAVSTGIASNMKCQPQRQSKESCLDDKECLTGYCNAGYCGCLNNEMCKFEFTKNKDKKYALCDTDGYCIKGKEKNPKELRKANGEFCETHPKDDSSAVETFECQSGVCDNTPVLPRQPPNQNFVGLKVCQGSKYVQSSGATPCENSEECGAGECAVDYYDMQANGAKTCGCGTTKDCSFGFICEGHHCKPKKLAGQTCKKGKGKHCLTNECMNNVCTCDPYTNAGCKFDENCVFDDDTYTYGCEDKFAGGRYCTDDYQCLSGLCLNTGFCSCGVEGSPASVDCVEKEFCDQRPANKFTDITTDGAGIECTTAYEGGVWCNDDSMCLSGKCSGNKCGCKTDPAVVDPIGCVDEDYGCFQDKCQELLVGGATCNPKQDMCKGFCDYDTEKCICYEDDDCAENKYCDDYTCRNTKAASTDAAETTCAGCNSWGRSYCECASGICNPDGTCGCVPADSTGFLLRAKCPTGLFCGSDNACSDKKSGNADCDNDSECVSDNCKDDKCFCSVDTDCEATHECVSSQGTCKLKDDERCDNVGVDETCLSGYCTQGDPYPVCGKGIGGESCTKDDHCASDSCKDGKCLCDSDGKCAGSGYFCSDNSQSKNECLPLRKGGERTFAVVDGVRRDSCESGKTYEADGNSYCQCGLAPDSSELIGCVDTTSQIPGLPEKTTKNFCLFDTSIMPNGGSVCRRKRIGGQGCGGPNLIQAYKDSFCLTGTCGQDNLCTCSSSVKCLEKYYCDNDTCVEKKNPTEQCAEGYECLSGNCENSKCGCGNGFWCNVGASNPTLYCTATQSNPGTCIDRLRGGEACTKDAECLSNDCNSSKKCTCDDNGDCDSTEFCNSGACQAKLTPQTECNDNGHCASDVCIDCANPPHSTKGYCNGYSFGFCECQQPGDCPIGQTCVDKGNWNKCENEATG